MRFKERKVFQRSSRCALFFCRWGNRLEFGGGDVIFPGSPRSGQLEPLLVMSHLRISPTHRCGGWLGPTSYPGVVQTACCVNSVFLFSHTQKIISCIYRHFNQDITYLYFHQCKFCFKGGSFKARSEEIPVLVTLLMTAKIYSIDYISTC